MSPAVAPPYRLDDLAARAGGQVFGDGALLIGGVAEPARAGPHDLIFLFEPGYRDAVASCGAAAVVLPLADPVLPQAQLVVPNPRLALAQLLPLFAAPPPFAGIHATAFVDADAHIAAGAALGPHVAVGAKSRVGAGSLLHPGVVVGRNVVIGEGCILYPHVVLYDDTRLGDRVILHAGTVIGSDGYGFVRDATGRHLKIPQLGNVVLGDDVETGANVAIDRGTFGSTVVGRGTKLDNLVHVGHNDRIGEDVLIVSQTGLSGSVTVEDRVTLAGQVGVAGHLRIGADAMVLARAGVTKDVPARSVVSGFPARRHPDEQRRQAAVASIPGLRRRLAVVEARLATFGQAPDFQEQPIDR